MQRIEASFVPDRLLNFRGYGEVSALEQNIGDLGSPSFRIGQVRRIKNIQESKKSHISPKNRKKITEIR